MSEKHNNLAPLDEAESALPLGRPPDLPQPFDIEKTVQRGELQWRLRILALAVPASIGVLLLLGRLVADNETLFRVNQLFGFYSFSVAVATVFGLSGFGLMFMYLQTGLNRHRFLDSYLDRAKRTWRGEANRATDIRRFPDQAEPRPSEAAAKEGAPAVIGAVNSSADIHVAPDKASVIAHLAPADYDVLTRGVITAIGDDLFGRLAKEFEERLSTDVILRRRVTYSTHEMDEMIDRLREESRRLNFRGNLNLLIGITITAIGVCALFYYVNAMKALPESQLAWRFIEHFLPRLSLVIFIEIFAYFFLRLYKESLGDIKYYQNEITNAQSRRLAVLLSTLAPTHETVAEVIAKLADTERNYILRKGESTPDLKKSEIERATTTEMLKEISSIVRAGIPGGGKPGSKETEA